MPKVKIIQKDFSGGVAGKSNQHGVTSQDFAHIQDSRNVISGRKRLLQTIPGYEDTPLTCLPTDKYLNFRFQGRVFHLIYDTLHIVKWGRTSMWDSRGGAVIGSNKGYTEQNFADLGLASWEQFNSSLVLPDLSRTTVFSQFRAGTISNVSEASPAARRFYADAYETHRLDILASYRRKLYMTTGMQREVKWRPSTATTEAAVRSHIDGKFLFIPRTVEDTGAWTRFLLYDENYRLLTRSIIRPLLADSDSGEPGRPDEPFLTRRPLRSVTSSETTQGTLSLVDTQALDFKAKRAAYGTTPYVYTPSVGGDSVILYDTTGHLPAIILPEFKPDSPTIDAWDIRAYYHFRPLGQVRHASWFDIENDFVPSGPATFFILQNRLGGATTVYNGGKLDEDESREKHSPILEIPDDKFGSTRGRTQDWKFTPVGVEPRTSSGDVLVEGAGGNTTVELGGLVYAFNGIHVDYRGSNFQTGEDDEDFTLKGDAVCFPERTVQGTNHIIPVWQEYTPPGYVNFGLDYLVVMEFVDTTGGGHILRTLSGFTETLQPDAATDFQPGFQIKGVEIKNKAFTLGHAARAIGRAFGSEDFSHEKLYAYYNKPVPHIELYRIDGSVDYRTHRFHKWDVISKMNRALATQKGGEDVTNNYTAAYLLYNYSSTETTFTTYTDMLELDSDGNANITANERSPSPVPADSRRVLGWGWLARSRYASLYADSPAPGGEIVMHGQAADKGLTQNGMTVATNRASLTLDDDDLMARMWNHMFITRLDGKLTTVAQGQGRVATVTRFDDIERIEFSGRYGLEFGLLQNVTPNANDPFNVALAVAGGTEILWASFENPNFVFGGVNFWFNFNVAAPDSVPTLTRGTPTAAVPPETVMANRYLLSADKREIYYIRENELYRAERYLDVTDIIGPDFVREDIQGIAFDPFNGCGYAFVGNRILFAEVDNKKETLGWFPLEFGIQGIGRPINGYLYYLSDGKLRRWSRDSDASYNHAKRPWVRFFDAQALAGLTTGIPPDTRPTLHDVRVAGVFPGAVHDLKTDDSKGGATPGGEVFRRPSQDGEGRMGLYLEGGEKIVSFEAGVDY